jgi:hypothetical protein
LKNSVRNSRPQRWPDPSHQPQSRGAATAEFQMVWKADVLRWHRHHYRGALYCLTCVGINVGIS